MIAVAAPAGVIAGLFALLFVLAWAQWGQTIVNTINVNVPIFGHLLAQLVSYTLNATYTALVYWFDRLIQPVSDLIMRPITAVENNFDALRSFASQTYNAMWTVNTITIPHAISTATGYADRVGDLVLGDAYTLAGQAVAHADAVGSAVLSDAYTLHAQALGYADRVGNLVLSDAYTLTNSALAHADAVGSTVLNDAIDLYHQGVAFTQGAYDAATGYAAGLVAQAEQDIAAAIVTAEGYANVTATSLVGQLATDIDQAVTGALGGIYTDIDTAISDVVNVAAGADADVIAGLRAIPRAIPLDIAGLAALAGATTLTLTRYLKECGIPNCKNLGQFGHELQDLLGVVNDAAFLALIVELVHNPSGAAGIFHSAFGDAVSTGVDLTRELLGI